jgi:hypothetical protein
LNRSWTRSTQCTKIMISILVAALKLYRLKLERHIHPFIITRNTRYWLPETKRWCYTRGILDYRWGTATRGKEWSDQQGGWRYILWHVPGRVLGRILSAAMVRSDMGCRVRIKQVFAVPVAHTWSDLITVSEQL